MRFSVIMPVFNSERFLQQAINSIVSQTFKDFELILIDDGSSDNSALICDNNSKQYDFIKVIHQRNSGPFISRNNGIKLASGDYILFCDSDDMFVKNAFQIISEKIDKYYCDILFFRYCDIDDNCNTYISNPVPFFDGDTVICDKLWIYKQLSLNRITSLWTKAFKAELLKNEASLNSNAQIRDLGEDTYLLINLVKKAKHILFIENRLYLYRQTNGSLAHDVSLQRHLTFVELSNYVFSYIKDLPFTQKDLNEIRTHWISDYVYLTKKTITTHLQQTEKIKYLKRIRSNPLFNEFLSKKFFIKPFKDQIIWFLLRLKRYKALTFIGRLIK